MVWMQMRWAVLSARLLRLDLFPTRRFWRFRSLSIPLIPLLMFWKSIILCGRKISLKIGHPTHQSLSFTKIDPNQRWFCSTKLINLSFQIWDPQFYEKKVLKLFFIFVCSHTQLWVYDSSHLSDNKIYLSFKWNKRILWLRLEGTLQTIWVLSAFKSQVLEKAIILVHDLEQIKENYHSELRWSEQRIKGNQNPKMLRFNSFMIQA